VLPQISHGLRSHAARPYIPVRRDLGRSHPGHAGNGLPLLTKRLLHEFVVLAPESLGHLGDSGQMLIAHAFQQGVDGHRVPLGRRRDAQADGVEFHALLGDLGDIGVGLQFTLDDLAQLGEQVDVEVRYDGVDTEREVLVLLLQLFEGRIRGHSVRPVVPHAADVVVLAADTIE
jgi:hypothetical protein